MTELTKFIISICGLLYKSNSLNKTLNMLYDGIFENLSDTLKLSVPAVLYTIQNNLLYVALSNLDAATFQVTYQLKILTTALFSVLLLNRKLNSLKWASLVILMFAVALVQWPSGDSARDEDPGEQSSSPVIGVGAILLACVSSGFSGVYIEKILKQSQTSMWIRNIQLSLMSLFIGLFGVFLSDWSAVSERGFFYGYSSVVVTVVILQAVGGLIVAAVMKYADNILKGFATSLSIVLSSFVSYFFLSDFHPTWFFVMGATFVLLATFLYGKPQPRTDTSPMADQTGHVVKTNVVKIS
ncbi:UDP-N-acetylglucosamine transporter-like isoform X2 [Halichondria panicea]